VYYGLLLEYGAHGEKRLVPVLSAARNSTLEIAWWPDHYAVHLKRNVLLRSTSGIRPIGLWRVVDLSFAWALWHELIGPLQERKHILGMSVDQRWEPLRRRKKDTE